MDTKAFRAFSSGLYVVSAHFEGDVSACVINTGMQLTSDPYQVQVVVNKQNHTQQVIDKAGHFALSAISQDADLMYIGRFGFRTSTEFNKFEDIPTEWTELGDPYTPINTVATLACEVVQTVDVGTHIIYVGRVVDAKVLSDAKPLTYLYYHTVIKGMTPPTASSYVEE